MNTSVPVCWQSQPVLSSAQRQEAAHPKGRPTLKEETAATLDLCWVLRLCQDALPRFAPGLQVDTW